MIIDAHCHLTQCQDASQVIADHLRHGIYGFTLAGTHPEDWQKQLALKAHHPNSFFILNFGLHPWFLSSSEAENDQSLQMLQQLIDQAHGLGELGLDYYKEKTASGRNHQQKIFEEQLKIGRRFNKPLVIHSVKAHQPCLSILGALSPHWRGMIHSFIGTEPIADQFLDLGFHLSLGPQILRGHHDAMIAMIPVDKLLIESDGPRENSDRSMAADLLAIAKHAAQVRNATPEELLEQSRKNLLALYEIKET